MLQVVLSLHNVDDGGGHLFFGGVVRRLSDGELAGAVGNDTLLSRLKLAEDCSDCSVLLTPICVHDERVFRVEPRIREDGYMK